MTNNTIPNVSRELLCELRDAANESMNATTRQHQIDHFAGLIAKADALLSDPLPAGGGGLEVVAWRIGFPNNAGYKVYEQRQPWAYEQYGVPSVIVYEVQELCRLSDAQAIIDGLRGEVERLQRAEKNDAIAYKAVLERQDELRAELAAIKAQEPVEYQLRALIRDVTNIPEAGYYMPQSWHDQVIALSLSGKLDAPVSEAKAQGVVQWPNADEIMQMAFEEGQPADDASGYCFELEEFDLFIERLMSEVARLNATPVHQVSVPDNEDWGVFFGYLIDKCEGHIVAEENLQGWLSEMLADPHYGALFRREKAPAEQPSPIALSIDAAEEEHGSLRAAAKALGIDPGYLSRLKSGEKINPGVEVLRALGLERVTYCRAMLAAAPAPPAADAGHVFYGMDGNHP